jgi:hypothetical protein
MNHTRFTLVPTLVAAVAFANAGAASASVKAGSQVAEGLIKHVSSTNVSIYNPRTKQSEGFVIVPRFGNVFKADGRTPKQVSDLHNGQYVKVYYDQKMLGVMHADRILIMQDNNMAMKTDKG